MICLEIVWTDTSCRPVNKRVNNGVIGDDTVGRCAPARAIIGTPPNKNCRLSKGVSDKDDTPVSENKPEEFLDPVSSFDSVYRDTYWSPLRTGGHNVSRWPTKQCRRYRFSTSAAVTGTLAIIKISRLRTCWDTHLPGFVFYISPGVSYTGMHIGQWRI